MKDQNFYIEDNLSTGFIEGLLNNKKKLIPQNTVVTLKKKLLSEKIVNMEMIFNALKRQEGWQLFLPDKFEDCRNFVANFVNSCSGLAFELSLEDAICKRGILH